jgi:hypothetical protein
MYAIAVTTDATAMAPEPISPSAAVVRCRAPTSSVLTPIR